MGLARALIDRPEILLYDEPTTGLDPVATKNVDEMIRRTADDFGVTSVVISHDMASTFRIGDRISMLARGQDRRHGHARRRCWPAAHPALREFVETSGLVAPGAGRGRHEAQLGVGHGRRAGRWSSALISYLLIRSISERAGGNEGYAVWALFHDASGLFEKSRVQTAGISVGQIEKRELDPKTARAKITIRIAAQHQAVRERRRVEEVGVAAGRVLPGDRSRQPSTRSVNGRAHARCACSRTATRSRTSSSRSRSAT